MSATRRTRAGGSTPRRDPLDYYATPEWCVRAIMPHLPRAGSILDPCAGEGAIVNALEACGVDPDTIDAMEIDPRRAAKIDSRADVEVVDALSDEAGMWHLPHGLVIANPPFSRALEFVERSLTAQAPHGGTTAMLLRLAFAEGRTRATFHSEHPSDMYVLSRRPSFTGDGKSDSAAYAWFVWAPGRSGSWTVLP